MTDHPAHFYHRKSTVLPPPLQDALFHLGQDLAKGRAKQADVTEIIEGLSALPVDDLRAASGDILLCAQLYSHTHSRGWLDLLGRGRTLQRLMAKTSGLAFILLFHGSGYIRQAALEYIDSAIHAPFLLAAAMQRLNDWVPEVRRAALACVSRVFAATSAAVVASAITGMLTVRFQWRRGVNEAQIIDEALTRADVRAALTAYMAQTQAGPVARTSGYLLRDGYFDDALPLLARQARHPAVRALALRTLLAGHARWIIGATTQWIDRSMGKGRRIPVFDYRPLTLTPEIDGLIRQGVADRAAAVRKVAMQAIRDQPELWDDFIDLIDDLSRDSSAAIREGVAYITRKRAGG